MKYIHSYVTFLSMNKLEAARMDHEFPRSSAVTPDVNSSPTSDPPFQVTQEHRCPHPNKCPNSEELECHKSMHHQNEHAGKIPVINLKLQL
jgi:hypothetical protein